MPAAENAPIIIKRKKVTGGDAHHGGAWKVAYADFVTAMMAFFMLMWLLNATTEQQRAGLADYFSQAIPIAKVSGGGAGALGGNNPTPDSLAEFTGEGSAPFQRGEPIKTVGGEELAAVAALRDAQDALLGRGGESLVSDEALRHVITRVTDEGLVIELFDRGDATLFEQRSDRPTPMLRELITGIAGVLEGLESDIAIGAHVRASARAAAFDPAWPLSMDRASSFRELLIASSFSANRVRRVTGYGDSVAVSSRKLSPRNNRIEITVMID